MLYLLTFELVLADQFCTIIFNVFYFLTLRIMNMTTQSHGNIDKEWSITKNVMSEKMEDIFFQTDFFVFLYKINWVLEALSFVFE